MKLLLAAAAVACALSGPSRAEEITLVEMGAARFAYVAETIKFWARGEVSADVVFTNMSDHVRQPIAVVVVCSRGDMGGNMWVNYFDGGAREQISWTFSGSRALDYVGGSLCELAALHARQGVPRLRP
jgi:hypothetical protein